MDDFATLPEALGSRELWQIIGLSLSVSLSATAAATILGQTLLALPIITALAHRAADEYWAAYGDVLMDLGASRLRAIPALIAMARALMLTAILAGFGRTVSEVGAIIIVGGNIAGYTRTMTTAIVLETGMGNLPLALGLGLVLIGLTTMICAGAFALAGRPNQ